MYTTEQIKNKAAAFADKLDRGGCSFHNGLQIGYENGFNDLQAEYEEKYRWIYCYEQLPQTAELVIVDSGNNLHACVAVAFYENEVWKYANGQKLWFRPTIWRHFL